MAAPLADRLRPRNLDDVVGQSHIVGEKGMIRRIMQSGSIPNMIFYGPPGTGKTTVAEILARQAGKKLFRLNGTSASTSDIREVISSLNTIDGMNGVVLYLDEIQYLNKKQQQSLLEVLEDGSVTLIASTTENPYFAIFNAILSRSTIFEFKPLQPADIREGITKAVNRYNGENSENILLTEKAADVLAFGCGGDMRKAFNALELLIAAAGFTDGEKVIDEVMAKQVSQRSANRFDNAGDEHYNLLSALQKSVRGSDENAALHYLARLLDGDGMLPAIRRILVMACEDIGLAYPSAISAVKACCDIALQVGMPEARLPLADAVILVCNSPKSNTAHDAVNAAMDDIRKGKSGPIPRQLQNKHFDGDDAEIKGQFYKYPHDYPNRWVAQQYFPDALKNAKYYEFGDNKQEQAAKEYWKKIKGRLAKKHQSLT